MQKHTSITFTKVDSSRKRKRKPKSRKDKGVASSRQEEEPTEECREVIEEEMPFIDLEKDPPLDQNVKAMMTPRHRDSLTTLSLLRGVLPL